jgi:hypothetical protein
MLENNMNVFKPFVEKNLSERHVAYSCILFITSLIKTDNSAVNDSSCTGIFNRKRKLKQFFLKANKKAVLFFYFKKRGRRLLWRKIRSTRLAFTFD